MLGPLYDTVTCPCPGPLRGLAHHAPFPRQRFPDLLWLPLSRVFQGTCSEPLHSQGTCPPPSGTAMALHPELASCSLSVPSKSTQASKSF